MVDRVKPWFMVHGSWLCSWFSVFLSPEMTCDTLLTLRGTWGFYLNHVHQSLSLRPIECALHNVLLEHGELPCVLPFDVYLDLGHYPDTQGYYLRLLPEPPRAQDFSVSPSPLGTELTGFDWVGAGLRGFGFWDGA